MRLATLGSSAQSSSTAAFCAGARTMTATVGKTLLYGYQGKPWPAVICDDNTPPQAFMSTKPTENVVPAILLGKVIYVWVLERRLRPFDPLKNYLEGITVPSRHESSKKSGAEDFGESKRYDAFAYHATHSSSPGFWKNYIEQRSVARRIEREIAAGRPRPRKRKRTLEVMDDTPRKRPTGSVIYRSSKRHDSVLSFEDLSTPADKHSGNPGLESLQLQQAKNIVWAKDNPPKEHECTIFVGEAMEPFQVPIQRCEFLGNLTICTEELKTHIDLSKEFDIDADQFIAVADYLNTSEFAPCLIEFNQTQWLEGVDTPQDNDRATNCIAKVYRTAIKLRCESLRSLCAKKLRTLHSISQQSLVTVAGLILNVDGTGSDVERDSCRLLNQLVAKQKSGCKRPRVFNTSVEARDSKD